MRETHMKHLIDGTDIVTTDPTPLCVKDKAQVYERDLRL
jgi:hypothetical protein